MSFNVGENVGPYRIVEQLGQGGMATVFKAYHASLDRYVALKVLHPAFNQDPNFEARFQREARVVAKLEHPNIVPIYDYAEHEKRPYLVMKFIEGITLKARMDQGVLSSEEITKIVDAVGSALAYAHKQGVLHRDIKPSNVLMASDGQIYLADFGLARIAQSGTSTLSSDMIMGTPQYISPEQAMGKSDLDQRTDLYSFGVMLYEMVVGKVPFNADTPFSIIHDHIYSPLPLPRNVNPNVPEPVERVLLKALAKEREDRFEDSMKLVGAFKNAWNEAGVPMQGSSADAGQVVPTKVVSVVEPEATRVAEPVIETKIASQPETPAPTRITSAAETKVRVEETPQKAAPVPKSEKKRSSWMWIGVALVAILCVGMFAFARSNRLFARIISRATDKAPVATSPTLTPHPVESPQPPPKHPSPFTVIASKFEPDKPPSNVLDGDPDTVWSAGSHPEQWIQIDLGKPTAINAIRLVVSQHPKGHTFHLLYVGPSEKDLFIVKEFIGDTSDSDVLVFKPEAPFTDIRFIKVLTKESPSWVAWREIEVELGSSALHVEPTSKVAPPPTSLPGVEVVPITSMHSGVPWLPIENAARPGVSYLGFNTVKPPFDNPIVRKAFAAATDRGLIVAVINKYTPELQAREATTLTPPEVLGRDLTGFVGIPFDPKHAKELLASAGYADPKKFPPVTLFIRATGAGEYPGLPVKVAEAIADSWRNTLGVEIIVSVTAEKLADRFSSNPPDVYRLGWVADYKDPDNFLRDIFSSSGTYKGEPNYGKFNNPNFKKLVDMARNEKDPAIRQTLYIQAEQILTQQDAAIIPLYFGIWNIP